MADFDHFYADYQTWMQYQTSERLADELGKLVPNGGSVLELGCGDGQLALRLAQHVDSVLGVDNAQSMISKAEAQRQESETNNVQFLLADMAQLAMEADTYALVVSSFAIHHVDVKAFLPRIVSCVRPGGWIFLQEPICPVHGALRPLWYRWNALKAFAPMVKRIGLIPTLRIQRFHQSKTWIEHLVSDDHWPVYKWQAVARQFLPGARVTDRDDHVIVLWQRPQASAASKRSDSSASVDDIASPQVIVKRHYPRPAPPDYVPFPRDAIEGSVVARFETQAEQHAGRIALRTPSLELTYAQLNATANRIGRQVLTHSHASQTPVALLMDQDDPIIPALLGVLKAGHPYVAIDPTESVERQQHIIDFVGAELVLTTAQRISSPALAMPRGVRCLLYEELNETAAPDNLGLALTADHLAAIFFTSGSTGQPKGVIRDHRQFLHSTWLNTQTYFVAPTDRQSLVYFPGFTASVPNIYDTLLNGATLCSLNPRNLSASVLLHWLRSERITHFNPPVGLWRSLVESITPGTLWPDLRLVTLAGQPLYGKDIREFQTAFGSHTVLLYVLGMTEAGAVTQAYIDHTTVPANEGLVPVGYPVADKQIVIHSEQGEPAKPGELGQIAIISAYLSLGYWQNEAETAERFRPYQDGTHRCTFLSNDRGTLRADGCLEFYGRSDAIVKVRGYRVDLAAIETVLNAHPQIAQAAVLVQTRSSGEGSLVAYLSRRQGPQGQPPTVSALRAHLAQTLPAYMIPERFVWLDTMPLTASGKLDRSALPALHSARPALSTPFTAPQGASEEKFAQIWRDLLEVAEIGRHDSFFDLGGDSLTAIRMLQMVEQATGKKVSVAFFQNPSIESLEKLLATETSETEQKLTIPPQRWTDADFTLWKMHRNGPILNGHVLPYGIGVRLQRIWLKLPPVQQRIRPRLAPYLTWWKILNQASPLVLETDVSLQANTWRFWRERAISNSQAFHKWVSVTGEQYLTEALAEKRGIVFVGVHTAIKNSAWRKFVELHSGQDTWTLGTSRQDPATAVAKLMKAREILQNRGFVHVAGDGGQGKQGIEIPVWGQPWLFRMGGAVLSQETNAILLPVFNTLDAQGRIRVKFSAPLTSNASDIQARSKDLTYQFAMQLNEHWPLLISNMGWGTLHRMLAYANDPSADKAE